MSTGLGPLTEDLAGQARRAPGRAATGPRSAAAGTATWTRTCGRCSAEKVRGRYNLRYCGNGSLTACRASLWAALKAAADELAAAQGPDPTKWRADATAERIRFAPGLLPDTMRWTNRPTFQQVLRFGR